MIMWYSERLIYDKKRKKERAIRRKISRAKTLANPDTLVEINKLAFEFLKSNSIVK